MDSVQQTKIESLVGRSMTIDEIDFANNNDYANLANSLSNNRTKYIQSFHTHLQILNLLGPIDGGIFLDALDNFIADGTNNCPSLLIPYFSAIKRSIAALYVDPGIDFGSINVLNVLSILASIGVLSTDSVNILKTVALVPDPISFITIESILNI